MELNAGFVALFAFSHTAIFDWTQWNTDTKDLSEGELERKCTEMSETITDAFWRMVEEYLRRNLLPHELSPEARKAWLQTGLALSPLFGTVAQHCVDVIVAWALIGEWSSRVLFPPPKGPWPRHGHTQYILERYLQRSPSLTAWARACFEQGALTPIPAWHCAGVYPAR